MSTEKPKSEAGDQKAEASKAPVAPAAPEPAPLLNVQIDGEWHQFAKGTKVIEACGQVGKFIPRYCYHNKLSAPGNCRMCMVEMGMPKMGPDRKPELGPDGKPLINWIPRPQISCAQDVAEGMAVRTDSQMVQEARKGVLEFLLINHPLDCPICDQAGECRLQEFSMECGNGQSRFLENKVKKPKKVEIGPRITLDAERCILCTRCIRFMREVAKDDVLGIVDRGSYNTIACHPDRQLDSNYSLNTADICPVGALTSNDFRFKMRVWFLKETKSICTSCATGCNTIIGSRQNTVYRQTPRENNDVNQAWMCDFGRLNFHYLESPDRLKAPAIKGNAVSWSEAIKAVVAELQKYSGAEIAILASGKMTNEELFLTRRIADAVGTQLIDIVPRTGEGDALLLSADRNPNTAGAKLLGVATGKLPEIAAEANAHKVKLLLALGEDALASGIDLKRIGTVIAMNILPDQTTNSANVVLPAAGFAEKRGSMVNKNSRLQRLNNAINPPGEARDDWEILADLLKGICGEQFATLEDVFKGIATSVPAFDGLTFSRIGDLGVQLK